ncbi:MAG TPA: flagellar basal body-associated FliL family protein [Candidatus Latescibacteria bacterium]|nr:flagellar basal body-associated FliL family protein [Candidatus Latescibacterota bacterium]
MNEQVEEQEPQEEQPKGRRRLFPFLLPPLIMVEVFVSHYIITNFLVPPPRAEVVEAKPKKKSPKEEKRPSGVGIYLIKDLIVNPAGTHGTRFFLVSLGLEYSPPGAEDKVKEQEPRIRDSLITILAKKTLAQLSDITYREKLRREINQAVQKVLADDAKVLHIYFVKYVLQ